jgi:hypothetical protein
MKSVAAGLLTWMVLLESNAVDLKTAGLLPFEPEETLTVSLPGSAMQTDPVFARQPLRFERNEGQTPAEVKFLVHGCGYQLFLTETESVIVLPTPAAKDTTWQNRDDRNAGFAPGRSRETASGRNEFCLFRMQLVGASSSPSITGEEGLRGKVNYFIGNDPAQWRTNIATFAKVRYREVYPGIDLVYYGNEGRLEYDFVVTPGADPNLIALKFEGADEVKTDQRGDLTVTVAGHELRWRKPLLYQEIDGVRREVAGGYRLGPAFAEHEGRRVHSVSFQIASYNRATALVIDPAFIYSTYFGGIGDDAGGGIAVDAEGNAYVAATTTSVNFPTKAALNPTRLGASDAVLAKFNPAGELVFSTYLGGTKDDVGGGFSPRVSLDAAGNPCIVGTTLSTDFPVLNAIQQTNGGGLDVFATSLKSDGTAISFSTYLGGSGNDIPYEVVISKLTSDIYIAGETRSADFPVLNALQPTLGGNEGYKDGFITKLKAGGAGLLYSTYFGGSYNEYITSLAEDELGNLLFAGFSYSDDLPVKNAMQPFNAGWDPDMGLDMFFGKLSPDGANLYYASYFGGSEADNADSITLGNNGTFILAGHTQSYGLATLNEPTPFDNQDGSWTEALIAVFKAADGTLVMSKYLGGSHSDSPTSAVVDQAGDILVAGSTGSVDFPTQDPLQPHLKTSTGFGSDGFLTKFRSADLNMEFSTFLGGTGSDDVRQIALDPNGNLLIVGSTDSANDFPLVNAIQPRLAGKKDVFVAKMTMRERLKVNRSGPSLVFSWPRSAIGYELESTATVGSGAVWRNVGTPPITIGDEQAVTVDTAVNPRFFRLRKP